MVQQLQSVNLDHLVNNTANREQWNTHFHQWYNFDRTVINQQRGIVGNRSGLVSISMTTRGRNGFQCIDERRHGSNLTILYSAQKGRRGNSWNEIPANQALFKALADRQQFLVFSGQKKLLKFLGFGLVTGADITSRIFAVKLLARPEPLVSLTGALSQNNESEDSDIEYDRQSVSYDLTSESSEQLTPIRSEQLT